MVSRSSRRFADAESRRQFSSSPRQTPSTSASIEVSDTGPGIPEEHQESIFDRNDRIDKSRSRELGGAGLGLSPARLAVESHGGHIEVDSSVNEGATFRVILPSSEQIGESR
jgi:signal transduction histidine kinase